MDAAFPRQLHDEILDHLAPDDPRARQSRKDLHRINRIMGSARIINAALNDLDCCAPRAHPGRGPKHILELGAGDGRLMLHIARQRSAHLRPAQVTLLDRQELVEAEVSSGFDALGCKLTVLTADVADWIATPDIARAASATTTASTASTARADVAIANLFIHHFDDAAIRALFAALAARVDTFIACEPRRARLPLLASRLVGLIGANSVTRTDAVLSVRAGFRDAELSACWPDHQRWRLEERRAGLFSHLFIATRRHADADGV